MTSTRRLSWALAIAIASTLCSAGCRQLAGYASSSPDLPDAGRVEGGVPEAGPPEAGWPEVGPPDGPGPLPPDDPAPPLLDVIQRPPYAVTIDGVGLRLPLFRDGTNYRDVQSIFGSDQLGWWIVGQKGWIAHNPGDGYRRVDDPQQPPGRDFEAVWASASSDVWIGGAIQLSGATQVLHFQGRTASNPFVYNAAPGSSMVVTGIRGRGPKDIWCSTNTAGTLLHYDGASLRSVPTSQNEVHRRPWIDDSGLLWFATRGGVASFEGQTKGWQQQQLGGVHTDTAFRSIFGLSPKRLYLGGANVLASWVDETVSQPFPAEKTTVAALWGRATNEVWAVGGPYVFRWDGNTWQTHWTDPSTTTSATRTFHDIAPCGALGTCVASSGGNVLRYHPAQSKPEHWRRIALAYEGNYRALVSVGTVGQGGTLWIISTAALLRERGWGVEVMPTEALKLIPGQRELRSAHATASSALWLVGDQNLLARLDRTSETIAIFPGPAPDANTNLRSVHVSSNGTLFVGANDNILYWRHLNMTAWQKVDIGATPRSLWSDGAGKLYIAASNGLWEHPIGTTTVTLLQGVDFEAVHGHGSDVWAVGGKEVWRRSGAAEPTKFAEFKSLALYAVYVPPSGKAWIAGEQGLLAHLNDNRDGFVQVESGTTALLRSLHGSGESDIWIGGDDLLLHYPDGP